MTEDKLTCSENKRIYRWSFVLFIYFLIWLYFEFLIFSSFLKCIFKFLFLAVLGLHCYTQSISSCSERGLLFVAVRGLLIAVASLVVSTGSRLAGFSSCGWKALERRLSSCDAQA